VFILLLMLFSLGIGIGSLLCEKLSKGKVEVGLVVFGAIGMTIFGTDLALSSMQLSHSIAVTTPQDFTLLLAQAVYWRILFDIALLGVFGGFYIVPLYALIQTRSEKSHQSRVIAGNNIFNALFMVTSAVFSIVLFNQGFTVPQLFLATAVLN